MTPNTVSTLSLCLSALSLLCAGTLAIIRFLEYIRDKKGLAVTYSTSNAPGEWNIIYLTNLSSIPLIINHWEMKWKEERNIPYFSKYVPIHLHDNEDLYLNIAPRARAKIEFDGPYEFDWHPKSRKPRDLFIELTIAGKKKPLLVLVYKN